MRFFFTGPRFMGVRPGISFSPRDFQRKVSSSPMGGQMTGSFVYVIADETGRHKIGSSRDPIQRIKDLQTGTAEKLSFAYIGVTPGTGFNVEYAAHNLLDDHRGNGEWFKVPASIAMGAVMEAATRLKEPIQQVSSEIVPQIIYLANQSEPATAKRSPGVLAFQIATGAVMGVFIAALIALASIIFSAPPH